MSKTGKSRFAILGMLALPKKSSGYELKKQMEASTQYFWKETFSSIYPIPDDLEQQRLIVKLDTPRKNDRKRNVYTLTSLGKKAVEQWLLKRPEEVQLRNEMLLKLFFGKFIPIEITLEHLKKYRDDMSNRLEAFKHIKASMFDNDSIDNIYGAITLDHGIRQTSSALQWCESAIEKLQMVVNKNSVRMWRFLYEYWLSPAL